jgi:hypothetical protein
MGRKRRQMSKIFGYKEGHTPSHKGKNLDYEQHSSSEPSHFLHFNLSIQANPHFLDAMESNSSSPSQPLFSIVCSFIAEFQRTLTRRQMSKIFGYKEGHTPSHKGKNLDYEQHSSSEPFMRIKHDVFESRVTQESDGILTVMDVNQSPCPPVDMIFISSQNVKEYLFLIKNQTFIENL